MRQGFVLVLLILVVAGCGAMEHLAGEPTPAASVSPGRVPSWLTGTWEGEAVQVGAHYVQGRTPMEIDVAADGSWTAALGNTQASGRVRVTGDRIEFDGAMEPLPAESDVSIGAGHLVNFSLQHADDALYGTAAASFGGPTAPAAIELRQPS